MMTIANKSVTNATLRELRRQGADYIARPEASLLKHLKNPTDRAARIRLAPKMVNGIGTGFDGLFLTGFRFPDVLLYK